MKFCFVWSHSVQHQTCLKSFIATVFVLECFMGFTWQDYGDSRIYVGVKIFYILNEDLELN